MLVISSMLGLVIVMGTDDGLIERSSPETRAVAFLSAEVPRWSRENRCFSCHNNGDAARALYQASRAGYHVPETALADTTRWLSRPADWEHNGGSGPQSDKRLARVVFTNALETAFETGWLRDRSVLSRAAAWLVLDQDADGSWKLEGDEDIGSPATYGRTLATFAARQCLSSADPDRYRVAIERADFWLRSQEILTVADASVCLMISGSIQPPAGNDRQKRSLELLGKGQSEDGGWGPRTQSPPESFDTALVLLGLAKCEPAPKVLTMIARGRAFLVAEQQTDGSWIETTRPPGNVSYAQRISTTGWAVQALLATQKLSARRRDDPKR
jgi:squalene cyclase